MCNLVKFFYNERKNIMKSTREEKMQEVMRLLEEGRRLSESSTTDAINLVIAETERIKKESAKLLNSAIELLAEVLSIDEGEIKDVYNI